MEFIAQEGAGGGQGNQVLGHTAPNFIIGRKEHYTTQGPLGCQVRGNACAQAPSQGKHFTRIGITLCHEPVVEGNRIGKESPFAGYAFA